MLPQYVHNAETSEGMDKSMPTLNHNYDLTCVCGQLLNDIAFTSKQGTKIILFLRDCTEHG
jgi:hypothetical protein